MTAPGYKVTKKLLKRGDGYGALDRDDMPDGKMFDELIADWAVNQLMQAHDQPFFMAVGFVRPHVPYTAPREFFDLYDLDAIEIPNVPDDEMTDVPLMGKSIAYGTIRTGDHHAVVNVSDSYWQAMVYGYLACVSFVDAQAGKILDALETGPHADNTIVVLWSDHGQHLGEKKHWLDRRIDAWKAHDSIPDWLR